MAAAKKIKQNIKYYDISKISKIKANYKLIIGQRGNGKTYALKKLCIDNFFNSKKGNRNEFGLIRRWQDDIKSTKAVYMFNDMQDYVAEKYSCKISFKNGTFYAVNVVDEKDKEVMGHIFAVNTGEDYKSIPYPNINLIYFDEFITRDQYAQDEFIKFINLISTIIRHRKDVQIYLLGNTIAKNNPYFDNMHIDVNKLKQGEIYISEAAAGGAKIAIEYCEQSNVSEENRDFFSFDSPRLKMITDGGFEVDEYKNELWGIDANGAINKIAKKQIKEKRKCEFNIEMFDNIYKVTRYIMKNGMNLYCFIKIDEYNHEFLITTSTEEKILKKFGNKPIVNINKLPFKPPISESTNLKKFYHQLIDDLNNMIECIRQKYYIVETNDDGENIRSLLLSTIASDIY